MFVFLDFIDLHILNLLDENHSNETDLFVFLVNNMKWLKSEIDNYPFDPYYHHGTIFFLN